MDHAQEGCLASAVSELLVAQLEQGAAEEVPQRVQISLLALHLQLESSQTRRTSAENLSTLSELQLGPAKEGERVKAGDAGDLWDE
jgi:hypothetical protein